MSAPAATALFDIDTARNPGLRSGEIAVIRKGRADADAGRLVVLSADSVVREAALGAVELLGGESLVGTSFLTIVAEEDRDDLERLLRLVRERGLEAMAELRLVGPDGRIRHVKAEASLRMTGAGREVLLQLEDGQPQATLRQRLERALPIVRSLTRDSRELIVVVGQTVGQHVVSGSIERTLGQPARGFSVRRLGSHIHPADRGRASLVLDGTGLKPRSSLAASFRLDDGSGGWRHIEAEVHDRPDDPDVRGAVFLFRDVTESRIRDEVTGLPNRVLLLDRIDQLLRSDPAPTFALLVLGLDRLQHVRANIGAGAADTMVVLFAERLNALSTAHWTVARTGESELAVIVSGLGSAAEARPLISRIGAMSNEPFQLCGQEVVSPVTIGAALSARRYTHARSMLHDAQVAHQRAREGGTTGGRLVATTQVLDMNLDRVRVETELYRALANDELLLQYQPIVTTDDEDLAGFEALVRWQHPVKGLVPPGLFLPVAEDTGQIVQIGEWVIDRACAQLRRWESAGPRGRTLTMAVNVSGRHLVGPSLVRSVEQALLTHKIDPFRLKLELTETALIENPDAAAATLTRLKRLGVRIALDDFGTGYCSLAYLTRFPVDVLKIDREFVSGEQGVLTSERGEPLVRAILDLARSLGIEVVAEGVETAPQAAAMRDLGCRYAQGWHFGRPLNPRDARKLIRAATRR